MSNKTMFSFKGKYSMRNSFIMVIVTIAISFYPVCMLYNSLLTLVLNKQPLEADPRPIPTAAGGQVSTPEPVQIQTVKVYVYTTVPNVWISHGGLPAEFGTRTWITFKSPTSRHHLKCNSSLTLELSFGADIGKFKENDAVLFNSHHSEGLMQRHLLALQKLGKSQGEKYRAWIFKLFESLANTRTRFPNVLKKLQTHAIIGYPRAAAINTVFGHYAPGKPASSPEKPLSEIIQNKKSILFWVCSNCKRTWWPRMDFVNDLKKHMTVDVFGACGNLTCKPDRSMKCYNILAKYKFFLSFENSECQDYITDRFWKPLMQGIVPVVYGSAKESYLRVAPPNSFIHVGDFNNTQELAKYLKYLDKNPKEYAKYLQWHQTGSCSLGGVNPLPYCEIPEVIRKVKLGLLKRKPLSAFPMYNACKPGCKIGLKYDTWRPW